MQQREFQNTFSSLHTDHMTGLDSDDLIFALRSKSTHLYCSEVTKGLLSGDPHFTKLVPFMVCGYITYILLEYISVCLVEVITSSRANHDKFKPGQQREGNINVLHCILHSNKSPLSHLCSNILGMDYQCNSVTSWSLSRLSHVCVYMYMCITVVTVNMCS